MSINYCGLLQKIIKQYDLIGLIPQTAVNDYCQEIEIINTILQDIYHNIISSQLKPSQAIFFISQVKDPQGRIIFSNEEAKQVYEKFQKLEKQQKGGSPKKCNKPIIQDHTKDLTKKKHKLIETTQTQLAKSQKTHQLDEEHLYNQNRKLQNKIDKDLRRHFKEKHLLQQQQKQIQQQGNLLENIQEQLEKVEDTSAIDSNMMLKQKQVLEKERKKLERGARDLVKDSKTELKRQKQTMNSKEKEINQKRQEVRDLEKQVNHNKELLSDLNPSKQGNLLNSGQKEIVNDRMDMMEMLLICLSLLPVAGWAFDFPLFIYALVKRRYSLAILTVLNWYIWGFWLIFGLNINMGPSMKVAYLANKQNYIKNSLIHNVSNPKKQTDPYTDVSIQEMDGKKYLVDGEGRVYNPVIRSPDVLGVMDKEKNKLIKKTDPNYYQVVEANRKSSKR